MLLLKLSLFDFRSLFKEEKRKNDFYLVCAIIELIIVFCSASTIEVTFPINKSKSVVEWLTSSKLKYAKIEEESSTKKYADFKQYFQNTISFSYCLNVFVLPLVASLRSTFMF